MTGADKDGDPLSGPQSIRIDKWLFHCRAVKSRSLAAKLVAGGGVSINGDRIQTAAKAVKPGDTVRFMRGSAETIYRIVACGTRRGPAPEAQQLYEDLSPPKEARPVSALDRMGPVRVPGSGRPTKRERRQTEKLRVDRDPEAGSDDGQS